MDLSRLKKGHLLGDAVITTKLDAVLSIQKRLWQTPALAPQNHDDFQSKLPQS